MILDLVFCLYKGGYPKVLNQNSSKFGDFVQAFGPHFRRSAANNWQISTSCFYIVE